MSCWDDIRSEIIVDLKPKEDEELQLLGFAEGLITELNEVLRDAGIDALAEVHGSVAHGTWISGQQDLDVFIVIENFIGREQLQVVLDAVRAGTDWVFTEAYAEHPYLQTRINGYSIDIVPCFRLDNGELHSATDRTPLHTRWLESRLGGLGDDVRLLKRFLMTLGIYEAEIKVGGFSGYLCELLVVYYGGFWELMEAAAKWGNKTEISFSDKPRRFNEPLTVIDPVDPSRNVASALREDAYGLFSAAARSFVKKSSMRFFRREQVDVTPGMVLETLRGRPSDILFLVIEESRADVPDSLWGQIHKSRQAVEQQLVNSDFNVLRSTAWSNEVNRHIFVFELESAEIPETVKRMGPPASLEGNVRQFIEAYRSNPRTISGPDLVGDRWYVLVKREFTSVVNLMDSLLADGGRSIGVSRKLSVRVLQHHRVLLNEGIEGYLSDGFAGYLFDWLKGRPLWIE